jgi:hypothetical protein
MTWATVVMVTLIDQVQEAAGWERPRVRALLWGLTLVGFVVGLAW